MDITTVMKVVLHGHEHKHGVDNGYQHDSTETTQHDQGLKLEKELKQHEHKSMIKVRKV